MSTLEYYDKASQHRYSGITAEHASFPGQRTQPKSVTCIPGYTASFSFKQASKQATGWLLAGSGAYLDWCRVCYGVKHSYRSTEAFVCEASAAAV